MVHAVFPGHAAIRSISIGSSSGINLRFPANGYAPPKRLATSNQHFTALLIDLSAAVRWVFFKRRFLIGFCVGWSAAITFNTAYVMIVLQHKCLFGYCLKDFF